MWCRVSTQLAKQDIRKAQKALGHKRIDTTARQYVLDELEAGLTDNLYWCMSSNGTENRHTLDLRARMGSSAGRTVG